MKKTLSVTVYNESGVLTRISTVFSSRGFNIDSIAVGPTENIGISKIIIVLPGDNQTIEQITKQLNKLIQVIEVKDITAKACVERELMLIKVSCKVTVLLPTAPATIAELLWKLLLKLKVPLLAVNWTVLIVLLVEFGPVSVTCIILEPDKAKSELE